MIDRIIGHRGAGVLAPENTIAALKVAHDLGLSHVEFDVRLTKDHVPIISHDDSLMRCAHIDQLVSQSNYADIKDVNVAEHYALADFYATIPTLEEYLAEAKALGLHCQVELKPNVGDEALLVEIAGAVLDGFYKDTPDDSLPLVTSFIPHCLKMLKDMAKRPYKTGVLVKVEETTNWKDLAARSSCDVIHVHALYLKKEFAEGMLAAGYKINGFHLNHPETAKKALALGCQKFTCDIPDVFLRNA
ncbi:MAG: hypothetical protein COB36_08775 [Alphaproteobacteria bacterium]|nr:MAG: hypothetical protein COB36_08775 [Alphaproteobacteria bacterium]